jgi:L-seryl-tRNA(Ser) seleniumtransferase
VGRKDLVEVAAINSFIGFETSGSFTIGRPMKVDRQEIFASVVALREWLAMDHEARLSRYYADSETILEALRNLDGVKAFRISDVEAPSATTRDGVRIVLDAPALAEAVFEALRSGDPSVWVRIDANNVNVSVGFLQDGEAEIVARRLREVLGA